MGSLKETNAYDDIVIGKKGERWSIPPSTYGNVEASTFSTVVPSGDKKHGIGVIVAMLFLMGEMCGGGVIAMPAALAQAGWYGIITIIVDAVIATYTGVQLAWCWVILQDTWPEYRQQTRKPYPEIGYRVGGKIVKYLVQFCVNITVFGTAVAFLVLASQNIQLLITNWVGVSLNYCWLLFIVSACLWPFTMLGTPKDFWPVSFGAISATTLAVILIVFGIAVDTDACYPKREQRPPTFVSFIQSYGIITYAFGGHVAFPTIQHDMKLPALFPKSVLYGYIAIFLLYFPMPLFGYLVYGATVQSPVYYSISTEWIQDAVTILITGHVLFAYIIFINPISQDLEDIIGIPKHFTWKRICTRTLMVLLVLFFGLTIPDFSTLLNVIGGTTIAALSLICPGLFYMVLRSKTQGQHRVEVYNSYGTIMQSNTNVPWYSHISSYGSHIAWWEWLVNGIIILIGVFGAVATVYAAIVTWQDLARPCYYPTVLMNGVVQGQAVNFTFCNA